jgi:hypothetical protein
MVTSGVRACIAPDQRAVRSSRNAGHSEHPPEFGPIGWTALSRSVKPPLAGYIKTAPIFKTYHANGQEFTIRTSFVATIASPDPLVYKFEIVSERSTGNDVWTPWHRIFSDDQKLVNEMQDRLSVK